MHLTVAYQSGSDGIRKLCDGLPSGWPFGSIGTMGYCWSGRLRTIASTRLFQGACDPHWVLRGHARFARERQTQGCLTI